MNWADPEQWSLGALPGALRWFPDLSVTDAAPRPPPGKFLQVYAPPSRSTVASL